MQIHTMLKERLNILGLTEKIYECRTSKCILSNEKLNLERVPWYQHAYFVTEGYEMNSLVFDPLSIVPCIALQPKSRDRILDMCAAPGTKTYIMSFMTNNEAEITANDIDRKRILRLNSNVRKYGIRCNVLNQSGRTLDGSFNKILVDAPCSGEGMINKKDKLFRHWSERRVRFLAKKQKKLISHAFEILEKDGTLVYATCTFAPEENEGVVSFLLDKNKDADVDAINAPIIHAAGITSWLGKTFDLRVKDCIRIYPQHNGTGGFFVAKIRKI